MQVQQIVIQILSEKERKEITQNIKRLLEPLSKVMTNAQHNFNSYCSLEKRERL